MPHMSSRRQAFSLVELSIVLVILGLLTGGILTGQSLIRAAELRNVTTQIDRYRAALHTFQGKYFAVPGDMRNATDFWSSAGGNGEDEACFDAQTTGDRATCNGTGDGATHHHTARNQAERFLAWKHLANAGLVEGSYSGRTNSSASVYDVVAGENMPQTALGSSSYIDYANQEVNHPHYFAESQLGHNTLLLFGSNSTGILTPEEAWNIDTKLDDGNPVYGKIFTTPQTSPLAGGCTTSDSASTANYDFSVTSSACFLSILQ